MQNRAIKSEKGVTLLALVIYIIVFVIILSIMSMVSNNFYKNVGIIKSSPKYISEFNKFAMFFVTDVKRNSDIASITATELEFTDGTRYVYKDNSIYRNEEKIAKYIKSFSFSQTDETVNEFTKKIITVDAVVGNKKEEIKRTIDFVLKYW